jgi:hypothetical protein
MRSNRRRNWFIKRIALGLAIAAFAAPAAQAKVDEGSSVQANGFQAFVSDFPSHPSTRVNVDHLGWPGVNPSDYALNTGDQIEVVRVEQPRSTGGDIIAADYGMPRAMPQDYAISRGDLIEVVRSTPSGTSSDKIEFVRTQPRSLGEPQVVAAGFNWKDAGIGAGLALALVLLGAGAALASRRIGHAQTA